MMIKGILDWETKRCLDKMEACDAYIIEHNDKTSEWLMMLRNNYKNIQNMQKKVDTYRKVEEYYAEEIWTACVWYGLYKEEE